MTLDLAKHDLEIAGVGYRVENYLKSETDTFIPRLGSGDQSESTFDLLKSRSIDDFKGGNLQRAWIDDHAIFGSENLYPIYDDDVLYPVKSLVKSSGIIGKSAITARIQTDTYLFLAVANFSGTNSLVRVSKTGVVTNCTLPANISGGVGQINDLVIWENKLVGSKNTDRMFYMDLTATSATEITGGTAVGPYRMAVYNGQLYFTGAGETNINLYKYTGTMTTRSYTKVGDVGTKTPDYYGELLVFSGRLYLTRADGLYAYDGIRLAIVDDAKSSIDVKNFRFPAVLRGYMYYFMKDGFYRYNGSMIEKLYDASEVGFPCDMVAGKNRLWICYRNSPDSGSSRYDKSMGYDYSTGTQINGRVACYNGKAMFTYSRTENITKPSSPDLSLQGENDKVISFGDTLYVFTYYEKNTPGAHFSMSTDELAATGTAPWRLVTSIFDADFSMINKSLENVELVLDTDAAADETITIEYRTTSFEGNTGWQTLGTIQTQSDLREYVYTNLPAGLTFRKIQLRFSGTTTVLAGGLKKIVLRYLLTPEFKWQWQFTVNAYGDNPLEPLLLNDSTESTQSVADLRGTIYAARATATPVGLTDIDRLDLVGDHNNSVQTLTLGTTALLKPSGFVKIDNEIIRYTAKTATTLTGCARGQLGTAAAAHTSGAGVFPYYRALVRRIQSEQVELGGDSKDSEAGKSKPSRITLILQEV